MKTQAWIRITTLLIAALVALASLDGIFGDPYPDDLRESLLPNDVLNLAMILPLLLAAMWGAQRGAVLAQIGWPAVLFAVFYTYVPYVVARPLSDWVLPYLLIVRLSLYSCIALLVTLPAATIVPKIVAAIPAKWAGGALVVLGGLFTFHISSSWALATFNDADLSLAERAVFAADSLILPAWIISGVWLWRRETRGYVFGAIVLLQASLLYAAVIILLLIQPLLTDADLVVGDVIGLTMTGMFCFVPCGLLVRGLMQPTAIRKADTAS